MHLTAHDELLLAVAAANLSVEHEQSHPEVADHAERLMGDLLDRHGVTAEEAISVVFD
jgi:hypothetical protein